MCCGRELPGTSWLIEKAFAWPLAQASRVKIRMKRQQILSQDARSADRTSKKQLDEPHKGTDEGASRARV